MKKILVIVFIVSFYMIVGKVSADTQLIPKEAIRIRVIGNSNEEKDQEIKKEIKTDLEEYYYELLQNVEGVENAKILIQKSLPEAKRLVSKYIPVENFTIDYGNHYFPEKEYKGILYEEGYYESLVVTLGEGKGKNWWCVLFPPLCLLENTEMEEVEYRSLVKDIIDQYF